MKNRPMVLRDDHDGMYRPVLMDVSLWGDENGIRIYGQKGEPISIEWGTPDEDGWYTPTFTIHYYHAAPLPKEMP